MAVKGIEDVQAEGEITASAVFGNKIFRNIVISLLATYGLYIISSLMALEPWHMSELCLTSFTDDGNVLLIGWVVTSFFQYLLIAPSYINVLKYVLIHLLFFSSPLLIVPQRICVLQRARCGMSTLKSFFFSFRVRC